MDENKINDSKNQFIETLKKYSEENIYNWDEIALFFKFARSKSLKLSN